MSRYADALAPFITRLRSQERGWFLVRCAPGEQDEIANTLASALGLAHGAITDDVEPYASCVLASPFGIEATARDTALRWLNARRDRLSDRGVWVLVVSRSDLLAVQRHAADIFSVLRGVEQVPLVPPVLDVAAQTAARRQLTDHYRDRFGRLDLRGFIRSESEDASFRIDDVFQPLDATPAAVPPTEVSSQALDAGPAPGSLLSLVQRSPGPVVIVGGPGAGKSFFLRWCALHPDELAVGTEQPMPVVISLAAVGLVPDEPTLDEYATEWLLAEGLAAGHMLAGAAERGQVLFLLDGLDEAGNLASRLATVDAVAALVTKYPRARVIVTSRPSGREGLEMENRLGATTLTIAPLSHHAVSTLLIRWCDLYERHREGTDAATPRGRAEGEQLAREVLESPSVRELATSPLLCTIIAIVHRAGVRLPDRRVELYDHVLRILVERWNQVRTREVPGAIPLRLPDAIRLLGPVALEIIEGDREGAVDEASLHGMLTRSLTAGNVRGLTDAGAAIDLFRRSLGVLVEHAPGVYGFLHQTLIEFLAAHELVRTDRLLPLVKSPRTAYLPKWREIVLLGAGIVGVLQANDERLGAVVRGLTRSARKLAGRPSSAIPDLLGTLLADDPGLTEAQVMEISAALNR